MLPLRLSSQRHSRSVSRPSLNAFNDKSLFEQTDNPAAVQTCKQRMKVAALIFVVAYCVISLKVLAVCLPHGIKINLPQTHMFHEQIIESPISRADILDRNGSILATSLPTVNLYANPKKIQNAEDAAEKLSFIFSDLSFEDIYKKLTKENSSFAMIKHNLSPEQQAEVNALGIPALEFQTSEKRVYLQNNLFAHVVGYTDIDNIGKTGVERSMHKRLTESSKPLQLTLDIGIQDAVREELAVALKKFKAERAAAILMDVNTGEVLSLVSLPDFNPNISIPVGDTSLFNFITLGIYEPGSVFKTFNTALGLESGKVKVTDKFDATKPIIVQKRRISDFHAKNKWLSVSEILTHSSNIGSVRIAERVGKEGQREFLKNLGFFDTVKDFELPEKTAPRFRSEKSWTPITVATVSYGHGISVTPLHIITAFSALVNGGIYHTPTIIKSDTQKISRRVVSEQTSDQMRPLLRDVVLYGSGKKADVEGYEVGGKTGTANKNVNGKYLQSSVTNSFLAAFPISHPKYALLVVLDEPQGIKETFNSRSSGWNAAPTTGKIIAAVAPQLGLKANFDIKTQKAHIKAAK